MNKYIKNIGKIFSGTFISRITGLIREIITARIFGTDKVADAIQMALTFPNLLRQVLGEDMVERAFMPPFKLKYSEDKNTGWKFVSSVFNIFTIILLFATLIMYLIIPLIFKLGREYPDKLNFIFGSGSFDYDLTLNLTLVMMPFMIIIGLAAFTGGILNFLERNWIFGFAPVSLNIGIILSIVLFEEKIGGYSLAIGWLFGGILQFLIQLPTFFSKKFKDETEFRFSFNLKGIEEEDKKIISKQAFYITLSSVFNKSSELINKILALNLLTGSISSITYATRFYQLPHGIISLSIARGIVPELATVKSNELVKFNSIYSKGIMLFFFILLPVTIFFSFSSYEIVSIFYKGQKFDEHSVIMTTNALAFFSLSILPLGLYGFFIRVFSILNKNLTSLWISIIGSLINILFSIILVNVFNFDHTGIALATVISTISNVLLGYFMIRKNGISINNKEFKKIIKIFFFMLPLLLFVIYLTFFPKNYNYFYQYQIYFGIFIKMAVVAIPLCILIFTDKTLRTLFLGVLRKGKKNG
ncbi:MAG: murein biosynthesis integral membrane protein MurJ [Candidatus Delongbacteria bacterium]|nr:murein biosynthesis integral membrane protein MurJ [Candidatus Delongbacteria bacterium]MBN2836262.1 murein biosynthesis integral membrane protein MurJ [Candidatus Delongbacteria bacterium]